jgi:hypothetical protein
MTLAKWIKTALERNDDNPKKAKVWVVKMASKNIELRKNLLRLGADQLVRNYYKNARQSAMSMATGRVLQNIDNPTVQTRIAARIARRDFWDLYTLYGMESLKTATKEALIESAQGRQTQANGELRLARFELAIAKRLNPGQRVMDAISVETVEKLAAKYGAANE